MAAAEADADPVPDPLANTTADQERRAVRMFYGAAVVCLAMVALFFYNAPPPSGPACDGVSLTGIVTKSKDVEQIRKVMQCASVYREEHEGFLVVGFFLLYVSLNTFAIPGPIVLSMLAGALYNFAIGTFLVFVSSTAGATACYLLSRYMGPPLLNGMGLSKTVDGFRQQVEARRKEGNAKVAYVIFLGRLTPVPSILINLASPLIGVPLHAFVVGSGIGMIPLNAVHYMSGKAVASAGSIPKKPALGVLAVGTLLCLVFMINERRKKASTAEAKDAKKTR